MIRFHPPVVVRVELMISGFCATCARTYDGSVAEN